MSQNKQEHPKGCKEIMYRVVANITSTTDPILRFVAKCGMTPVAFTIHPLTSFDFTTGDETYALSVEDDGVAISTANTAIAAGNKTAPAEATFAASTQIAKDSVVELIVTLAGTTPIIPAGSLVVFSYLEGGI
jgi:hypothetical protein